MQSQEVDRQLGSPPSRHIALPPASRATERFPTAAGRQRPKYLVQADLAEAVAAPHQYPRHNAVAE